MYLAGLARKGYSSFALYSAPNMKEVNSMGTDLTIVSEYPVSQIIHRCFEGVQLRPSYIRKQGNIRLYKIYRAKEVQIHKLLLMDPNLTIIKSKP